MPRLLADVATRRSDEADLASTDEVIVYKDEGDADDVKSGLVENLTEEKLGLLTETEQVSTVLPGTNAARFEPPDVNENMVLRSM